MSGAPLNDVIVPLNVGGIHTQADNFLQSMQASVDPRTGQFPLQFSVPLGTANAMTGPTFAITWAFSSLASHSASGYGLGWSLMYSQLIKDQDVWTLQLSSGEQFAIDTRQDTGIGSKLSFHDYKLRAMHVTVVDANTFKIEHKSGESEILRRVYDRGARYVLHELRSPEGRKLYLDWTQTNGVDYLAAVRDETRTLARLERQGNARLILEPGSVHESVYQFFMTNGRLSRIQLPEVDTPLRFSYESKSVGKNQQLLFPTTCTNPLGAEDKILWSTTAQNSHQLPPDAPLGFLPRVTRWEHRSGAGLPVLTRHYTWHGTRNFLGYGNAQHDFNWQKGRDNLYQLRIQYEYQVTEEQSDSSGLLATITRRWDRHHLLLAETTVSGNCQTEKLSEYHVDYQKSWADQPAYCQLVRYARTCYTDLSTEQSREEVTEHHYDDYGNITFTRLPTGVTETFEYFPLQGEPGRCPADNSAMVRLMKSKTVTPGPDSVVRVVPAAPVLSTHYNYQDLPSLIDGEPPHALVSQEQLYNDTEETVVETTTQKYLKNLEHYGRIEEAVTTLGPAGSADSSTSTFYRYLFDDVMAPMELTTETRIQGFEGDAVNSSTTSEKRSLVTGFTVQETSAAGAVTNYQYDALGRIVLTQIAHGTPYAVERSCSYHVDDAFVQSNRPLRTTRDGSEPLPSSASQEEIDALGRRKQSWLDGHGRVLLVRLEDLDHSAGTFRTVTETVYDAQGRNTEHTAHDWQAGAPLFSLTTRSAYDDWGNLCREEAPTGVAAHTRHDPVLMLTEQWQTDAAGKPGSKTLTQSNIAGSPIRTELYDQNGRKVRTTFLERDGLDRVMQERVVLADGTRLIKDFTHDAYSRVCTSTTWYQEQSATCARRISKVYAPHSDADHPVSIAVSHIPGVPAK